MGGLSLQSLLSGGSVNKVLNEEANLINFTLNRMLDIF